jgi:hypothetical protein
MKRFLLMTGMLGLGVVLFILLRPPEPKYQNRTISSWQDDWAALRNRDWPTALQHIGTNALPYAVRNLAMNDSEWRIQYAALQDHMPGLLQKIFRKPKPLLQEVDGANLFYFLGPNAVPLAIALLKHDSPTVRRSAAWGLGSMRRRTADADQAIPSLIGALSDPDRMVRFQAAGALKEMGPDASNAVPALARIVSDRGVGAETNDYFYLRAVAAAALGKIGPAACGARPALEGALHESNSYLRGQAAVSIWRINSNVDDTLPVLLREMPLTNEHSKWDWIIALGEMGPRARPALPQLTNELHTDRENWVLSYVTNALKSVGTEESQE